MCQTVSACVGFNILLDSRHILHHLGGIAIKSPKSLSIEIVVIENDGDYGPLAVEIPTYVHMRKENGKSTCK